MKHRLVILGMIFTLIASVVGCGKEKEEKEVQEQEKQTAKVVQEIEEEVEAEQEDAHKGMAKSYLTGEWIKKKKANLRPYAVMIGNTADALPQYGISKADIIYEAPVEGSYTRLMGIFQDITDIEKLGSVRSSRHYYIYFAQEFDAIYAHYGQSVYAKPILAQSDVHNINGLEGEIENLAYYRDDTRLAPHNVFTTAEGLKAATEKKEYETKHDKNYEGHYIFAEDDAAVNLEEGVDAMVVSPGYFVNKPWFVFDEKEMVYLRYQFQAEQVDGQTEEQLKVKNIIIQYCNGRVVDDTGRLDFDLVSTDGSGTGKYITNGKAIDVTWKKESNTSPTHYYDANGKEIVLNQGKTWVCVMRTAYKERTEIYATKEEFKGAN